MDGPVDALESGWPTLEVVDWGSAFRWEIVNDCDHKQPVQDEDVDESNNQIS